MEVGGRSTLDVLNASGHLSIAWDVDNEAEVKAAEEAIEALKARGYAFFEATGVPGKLTIQKAPAPSPKRRGARKRHVAIPPMAGG